MRDLEQKDFDHLLHTLIENAVLRGLALAEIKRILLETAAHLHQDDNCPACGKAA